MRESSIAKGCNKGTELSIQRLDDVKEKAHYQDSAHRAELVLEWNRLLYLIAYVFVTQGQRMQKLDRYQYCLSVLFVR